METNNISQKIADSFKVLADPTRINMLLSIMKTEKCVHEIATELNMTISAISHQFKYLRMANIVVARKEGKHVYYRLLDEHVTTVLMMMYEHVKNGC